MINILQTFRFPAAFWSERQVEAFRTCDLKTKMLAIYLMTSPFGNKLGLYYLPLDMMRHHTGLSLQAVKKALTELNRRRFCFYDYEYHFVWIFDFIHTQIKFPLTSKGFRRHVDDLMRNTPSLPFLGTFFKRHPELIEFGTVYHADIVKNIKVPTT